MALTCRRGRSYWRRIGTLGLRGAYLASPLDERRSSLGLWLGHSKPELVCPLVQRCWICRYCIPLSRQPNYERWLLLTISIPAIICTSFLEAPTGLIVSGDGFFRDVVCNEDGIGLIAHIISRFAIDGQWCCSWRNVDLCDGQTNGRNMPQVDVNAPAHCMFQL